MVSSTTAAGTINQTARGGVSFATKSASDVDPTAFSLANSLIDFGDMSNTTHWCPFRMTRRAMLAPILPRPIIPSCISVPLSQDSAA